MSNSKKSHQRWIRIRRFIIRAKLVLGLVLLVLKLVMLGFELLG